MIEVPGTDLIPGKQYWVVCYGPRSAIPPHTRATLYKSHCTFTEGNNVLLLFICDRRTFPIVNNANAGLVGGPNHHHINAPPTWNAHENFIWKFYDVVEPRVRAEKDARDREHAMRVTMEREMGSRGKSVPRTTPGVQPPSNHPFDPGYFTRGGKGRRRGRRGKGTTRKRRASHRKRRTTRTSSRTKKTRKRGTRSRRRRL